jgi:5-methylcytosine-specific restriction endonuclease McrA
LAVEPPLIEIQMKPKHTIQPFAYDLDEADQKRERVRAKALRESQWWKRRLAKGICYYCNREFTPKLLTMDHIVPISRGGRSTKGNVVPCCKECNIVKKQLLPMEWVKYLEQFDRPLF